MKFYPWSLRMRDGFPLLATKCHRQAIKASVVRSKTSSRCTAFTESETNTHTYDLTRVGFLTYPYFVRIQVWRHVQTGAVP